MTTRRTFLTGVAGTAAVTTLSGCLGFFDDDGEDPIPGSGEETDDELLLSVADPSSQVPPLFFSGYQYRVSELAGEIDLTETIPRAGGAVAGLFEDSLDEVSLSDLDYITGGIYNSTASDGDLQVQPLPSGQAVHAVGEFDADPLLEIVEDSGAHESRGESDGFERYYTTISDGDGVEGWGIRDGQLIIVSRTDVTSRSAQYDDVEETIEDALAIEFDQLDRDDAPIEDSAPAFAEAVRELDDGPIRAGAGYALVPKGSDTGVTAFDDAIRGVVGAGVSATLGDESELQRAVSYLDEEMASEETVGAAYEAAEEDGVAADAWEFATAERTVSARASLSEIPESAVLETALPVPGYESIFTRVNPNSLGREPTPRVFFQPAVENGTLKVTHVGGEEIEDLRVRYIHDGEPLREPWEGPVSEGDEYTTKETIDSGTQAWVTWRPDTVDAAVLTRFETPA